MPVLPSRLVFCLVLLIAGAVSAAEKQVIPHAQDKPPGPPLSPQAALAKMEVPEGFSVELVVSEPDLVNPVAMTFDAKGRIWVTESLEYPRPSAGPGRDRVKVLEDTDRDGKIDKTTIFADGLNIPSGIAVGHGGVWVANSPDILFFEDIDGDLKADRREVVVTGFGRADRHELPNSLCWGPDGWLYGLNGVFNPSHIKYRGKEYRFTCALFRIHPRTRDFEVFCEGTSNPWGVAWNPEGSAFVSACVIDHLWHLAESGYYHRQGGPYPPFTWKIGSIVDHKHQKRAYCGLHYFDSAAYPPKYRDLLYMGNIHGNCVNVDQLHRDGSTYRATAKTDFLTAHDAWFMPVSQKTGPDGCLYILDWYDRYHCYQDAQRDPKGIDRLKGRLYRVRYKNTPRAPAFDLRSETDDQLIARLASPNIFFRNKAQQILQERNSAAARPKLQALVFDESAGDKTRRHALFALVGAGPLEKEFHARLLAADEPTFRAWGVRAAGNMGEVAPRLRETIATLSRDPSPDVKLQVAIAAGKIEGMASLPVWLVVLQSAGDDKLIPHIVWQNLEPRLKDEAARFVQLWRETEPVKSSATERFLPVLINRLVLGETRGPSALAGLFQMLAGGPHSNPDMAAELLQQLTQATLTGQLKGDRLARLRGKLALPLKAVRAADKHPRLSIEASRLAAVWGDADALRAVAAQLNSPKTPESERVAALEVLLFADESAALESAAALLADAQRSSPNLRRAVLDLLGRSDDARVAEIVLANYAALAPDARPRAIELLTARPAWSKQLLAAIAEGRIDRHALNVNQVRKLLASKDAELTKAVRETWGTIRAERNPQREQVIAQMRALLTKTPGNAERGWAVYRKVCGQCHKLHGEGQEVGPDLTGNGRSSFDQLLSNVFDPSLVIGAAYQASTVITTDGRVLTGLIIEDGPRRVVLKLQGGKTETIARDRIDAMQRGKLSLMPEGLEKQFTPQELADLFALLTLDRPPSDPKARRIPGSGGLPRE